MRGTQGMCALVYVLAKGRGVIILGAGRRDGRVWNITTTLEIGLRAKQCVNRLEQ